jgi:DNA-directed RNA polymerase specialized sigma24 family protein
MVEESLPGAFARFPPTRQSAVLGVGSDDPAARARSFDILVRAYWKPVYTHVRARWRRSAEEAQDLTQGFFARAFERHYFEDYDAQTAHFRTYLKTCLDRFVMDDDRAGRRLKRGGNVTRLSLDFASAEVELQQVGLPSGNDVDSCFDQAWMRHLLGAAVDQLRDQCAEQHKDVHFELFRRAVLQDEDARSANERRGTSYRDLAAELELSVSQVTNYLAWSRREFRRIVFEQLRELTVTEEEFRDEAKALLGVDP